MTSTGPLQGTGKAELYNTESCVLCDIARAIPSTHFPLGQ